MKKEINSPRLLSFAFHLGDTEVQLPITPDSPYIIDDSSFVPIAEAIKQLGNGASIGAKEQLNYDFPDGKDNGMEIPFSRSAQFKDIAELSTEINNTQESIQNELDKAKKEKEFRDQVAKELSPNLSADTPAS